MGEIIEEISKSVKKKDHDMKMDGSAVYLADMKLPGMLYGAMVRSNIACGKILSITLPDLPEGCYAIQGKDVPGENALKVIGSEQPVFADTFVRYIGEGILMIAAPTKAQAKQLAARVRVAYEEEKAVLSLEEATETAASYHYTKGNPDQVFEGAAEIIEETFETGYQEQAYIEPQSAIGIYENGKSIVYASMQCPYYVRDAVKQTMGVENEQVQIIQTVTGGG